MEQFFTTNRAIVASVSGQAFFVIGLRELDASIATLRAAILDAEASAAIDAPAPNGVHRELAAGR